MASSGDYLFFHPHLHVLAADGLFPPDGHFHCMPAEDLDPAIELFRHRFLQALRDGKHISPKKLADLLSWKHSGFHIHDGGEKPVAAHDSARRKRCGWSILLQTVQGASRSLFSSPSPWPNPAHPRPHHPRTLFKSKIQNPKSKINNHQSEILLIPAPPKQSARDMRPLWRDLILQVWGGDPLQCTCCKGTMKPVRKVIRREEIEFFLRLHGLWEGIVQVVEFVRQAIKIIDQQAHPQRGCLNCALRYDDPPPPPRPLAHQQPLPLEQPQRRFHRFIRHPKVPRQTVHARHLGIPEPADECFPQVCGNLFGGGEDAQALHAGETIRYKVWNGEKIFLYGLRRAGQLATATQDTAFSAAPNPAPNPEFKHEIPSTKSETKRRKSQTTNDTNFHEWVSRQAIIAAQPPRYSCPFVVEKPNL